MATCSECGFARVRNWRSPWPRRSRETRRKNRCIVGVLIDVPVNSHGDARLARLLRLLRPAPEAWVARAQRIPLGDEPSGSTGRGRDRTDRWRPGDPREGARDRPGVSAALRRRPRRCGRGGRAARARVGTGAGAARARSSCRADRKRRRLPGRAAPRPGGGARRCGYAHGDRRALLRALAVPDEVLAKLPDFVAHQHEQLPIKARLCFFSSGALRSPRRFVSDACAGTALEAVPAEARHRSVHRPEIVLTEPVRDVLADHRAMHVGGSEVDPAPDPRADDLLGTSEKRSKWRGGIGTPLRERPETT